MRQLLVIEFERRDHHAQAAGTPKHGGTLHAGLTGGSSSDTADPNTIVNNTDYARAAEPVRGARVDELPRRSSTTGSPRR